MIRPWKKYCTSGPYTDALQVWMGYTAKVDPARVIKRQYGYAMVRYREHGAPNDAVCAGRSVDARTRIMELQGLVRLRGPNWRRQGPNGPANPARRMQMSR